MFHKTLHHIHNGIDQGWHLGAQLTVYQDGVCLTQMGVGEARPGEPMQANHLMLWMSACKPLTAIAIAKLWERGRLNLDQPVIDFIPNFGQHGKEAITIFHLLTHTGGFRNADIGWKPRSWEDSIELICASRREPRWELGVTAGYHVDASWYILGEIIRIVDGRPFEGFLRDEVLHPLGMHHTYIGMPVDDYTFYGRRIAPVYDTTEGRMRQRTLYSSEAGCGLVRPGGNGRGPASDLALFYKGMLEGKLIKAETLHYVLRRHREGTFDKTFRHAMDWGLGFMLGSNRYGVDTLPYGMGALTSDNAFGHGGNQVSMAFADPDYQRVVTLVFNGQPGDVIHQQRMRTVLRAIYEDLMAI